MRSSTFGLALAGRGQQLDTQLGQALVELVTVVVLVGDQQLPWPGGYSSGSMASSSARISRSTALAPVKANQNQREWLAHQP